MTSQMCPDLEELFAQQAEGAGPALEHARSCPACSALLEEHRQLEKDLFRLADPLPPPDLVKNVMAAVRAQPAPVAREVRSALIIYGCAIAGLVATMIARGVGLADVGAFLANAMVSLRPMMLGLASGLAVLWKTAAAPLMIVMLLLSVVSLFGLRRMVGQDAKVSP